MFFDEALPPYDFDGLLTPEDTVIALMGMTGAGKSTFISHFCGGPQGPVIGHDLASCTADIGVHRCTLSNGSSLVLLDTPGFGDTDRTDEEVLYQITEFIGAAAKVGVELTAIVYLHPIDESRMTGSARDSLDVLRDFSKPEALRNVALVTTKWQNLPNPDLGEQRLEALCKGFWEDMLQGGSTHWEHWGDRDSADEILTSLTAREKLPMRIAQLAADSAAPGSAFGWAMVRKLNREIQTLENRMDRLEAQLKKNSQSRARKISLNNCASELCETRKRRDEFELYGKKMKDKKFLRNFGKGAAVGVTAGTLGIAGVPALIGYSVWKGILNVMISEDDRLGSRKDWDGK